MTILQRNYASSLSLSSLLRGQHAGGEQGQASEGERRNSLSKSTELAIF